ncbi:hypothetical protein EIP91_000090 [Steccherinum ochraceum]|uniref:Uncharacterized protein n=1 Tax=Steccherinum ochraceum TaxID=92696 RepID=A0A4R0S2S8_9APHY|nr:hypothetical protein EIP91_000090 [Steccherinum ochraceum]
MTTPIPSPPGLPILGHATMIDKDLALKSFRNWATQYGEIYRLNILTDRRVVVINTYELLNEVCNDERFYKSLGGPLEETRTGLLDGLFTAYHGEANWGPAHRLLMPAFGVTAVRSMFDDMLDIASQLVLKWERFGQAAKLDPAEDFTRLTLDTIALTSMSYRINSFYRARLPKSDSKATAMLDFLIESGLRANRPAIVNAMMRSSRYKYEQDIKIMSDLADEIVADRKKNPIDKPDLLNLMLNEKDHKTGLGLSDENIRYNLLTFLVAGHETTSGTLTFAVYYLLKYPDTMRKLREEIDSVLGDEVMQASDLSKLPYCLAVLREALRLRAPASMRTAKPFEDTVIGGGKYFIDKDMTIAANIWDIHRDPKVWGDDAEEFKPERMMNGKFEALPPNAWQPFGFGSRACIGRALAIQEAQIALACVVQKFNLSMADPNYELQLKQSLTLKPNHFYIHASPRADKAHLRISQPSTSAPKGPPAKGPNSAPGSQDGGHPLHVLYGSNTGSSESFAQRIASDAVHYGFNAKLGTLDSAANRLPTDRPVVIVTASFEGQPADNAAAFVEWIENLSGPQFSNLRYAVFGCGNREWVQTYQRIPRLVDTRLGELGGTNILERGEGDASAGTFFESFDKWEEDLFEALSKEYSTTVSEETNAGLGIEVTSIDAGTGRASALRQTDAALGTVVETRLLTAPGAPAKRHIEFDLPEGMGYRAGDYLAILPTNPQRNVQRVLNHFKLSAEQEVTLSSSGPTSLPVDKPISVLQLFSGYVELSQPATTRDLTILTQTESSADTSGKLRVMSANFNETIANKRLSILDILEDHPDIKLPLGSFIAMLPTMRIRQYSISSSPLWNARRVSLTVSILESTSISGRSEIFLGVASTYLASLKPGDKAQVAVRNSSTTFHPPDDVSVPMVVFCAGSGLAPMRGFIQERALQKSKGKDVAQVLLFFGCRKPDEDYLYSDTDLKAWQELGVLDVRPAFSRKTENSEGCKYVQDRVWHDRTDIHKAYDAGAKLFTCGSRRVANGLKETLTAIIKEREQVSDEMAATLYQRATASRYATDIFD